jgi:tetratricopeptide (TPR) repeat protein
LDKISVLLSKPYEVRILELRHRADALFQNSLRNPNENQTRNLQTSLGIYQKITEDVVGQLDYLVWFQIGWLNWQLMDDPAAAREAFDEAQRLSDGAGNNEAFRAKSLRHLARMHFLLSDFEEARTAIGRALSIRANDPHALHDAALYSALAGRKNDAHSYFSLALKHDPVLFISTQLDPDFDQIEITPELLDYELQTQLDRVSHLLRKMDAFFTNILPVWDELSESVPPAIGLFISTRSAAHENAAAAGYVTLRQLEIDMAQATGAALLETREALADRMKEVREDLDRIEQQKLAAMDYPRSEAERVERIYQEQRNDAMAEARVKAPHPDDLTFEWLADLVGEIFTKAGCLAWPASIIAFLWLVQVLNEKTKGWLSAGFLAILAICLGALVIVMAVLFIYSKLYNIAERLKGIPLAKRLEALRREHELKVGGMAKEPHPNILARIEVELHGCAESLVLYTECQKQINELDRA